MKIRAFLLVAAMLSCAMLARAQASYDTTVTGTVTDPNGFAYAGGTINFRLTTPGGVSPYITSLGSSASVQAMYGPARLDANGAFSLSVPDNTKITPSGTTWAITVCSAAPNLPSPAGNGPQCFSVSETISGSSQDLTAALDAAAPVLVNSVRQSGSIVNSALSTIGPAIGSTGIDLSSHTGRAAGLSVNIVNDGVTVTGLRGIDSRVSDSGTNAEVVGVQGLGTKTGGDSTAGGNSLWGGNFIADITGGKTSNVYGVYGEGDAETGTTVTGGSCAICFVNGLQGYGRASAGATLTTAFITGVTGIVGQQSGDAKGTAAVLALLEGRLNQATTGVIALFKGGNYNNQVNPDYGLDLDTTVGGVALAFNDADIRMSSGATIKGTAYGSEFSGGIQSAPTAFSAAPSCAAGIEGLRWSFTDSTTNTWGNTITGGGSDHVGGYCDGANWTVEAK
jgi:hypothetical protein